MQLSGNTILITGGSEGIGFALAKALHRENKVIVCGRDGDKLARAKAELPGVVTLVCDLTRPEQREVLVSQVLERCPDLNVLMNNAGGRQVIDLLAGEATGTALKADFALNFFAPVSLCDRLLPHLRAQSTAAIVNVTSGLVYLPKTDYPFYCAAKAALHSYTQSLRRALRTTPVRVHEALLPLVKTNFHCGELPAAIRAMSAEKAALQCLSGLGRGKEEIHIGQASLARWMACVRPQKGMDMVNRQRRTGASRSD